jgi:ribosomal protein L37AE/L43A
MPQENEPLDLPYISDYVPPVKEPSVSESKPAVSARVESNTMSKCPKCGSSDINYLASSGTWICSYCRFKWDPSKSETFDKAAKLDTPLSELVGTVIVSAAADIALDSDQLTLKCQACGAEVIVNTRDAVSARCHWCRQTLSLNEQVPNGAVPDAILPFSITKDRAVENIAAFVKERRFFALPKFTKEFNPENVIGVYLPYALVDGNLSAELHGQGEIQTRTWTETRNKSTVRYYDADVYNVSRKFDFHVDDLTVEASKLKSDIQIGTKQENTNNIINSILPFDTKKAIPYKSTFMAGFNSERRDLNVDAMVPMVKDQFMSIARSVATDSAAQYSDRGIRWDREHIEVKGTRWVSVYLPVWLYSYYEPERELMHYVAVNGQTGETMGSVPVHYRKLWAASLAIGITLEVLSWPIIAAYFGARYA